jgi:nucleoside-triphosphatase THEP1
MGQRHLAVDALWRAASEADLLAIDEVNGDKLTTERIVYLLDRLGWA